MHDNSITINDSGPCYRLPGSQIAGSSKQAGNRIETVECRMD